MCVITSKEYPQREHYNVSLICSIQIRNMRHKIESPCLLFRTLYESATSFYYIISKFKPYFITKFIPIKLSLSFLYYFFTKHKYLQLIANFQQDKPKERQKNLNNRTALLVKTRSIQGKYFIFI